MKTLYTNAGTKYRIRVKFYNAKVYGTTKLSIVSTNGLLNSGASSLTTYENIYSINGDSYTLSTDATINYNKVVAFTPTEEGTYTFELNSTFDNYIYVVDPGSSDLLINNIDYNDDGGTGYNAKLSRYLNAGTPYLIICCKFNPGSAFSDADSTTLRLTIEKIGFPTVPSTPSYLQLTLTSRSGFIVYNWDVKITNNNSFAVQVTYNSKMCFESAAKNFTGLNDLVTITIPANSSITVTINGNGAAGWITTCIDYAYSTNCYRRITCANGLSSNLTMNTPINTTISCG